MATAENALKHSTSAAVKRPVEVFWVAVYCYFSAVLSLLLAAVIFLAPSWVDDVAEMFSLTLDGIYGWAIVQFISGVLSFYAGRLCLRGECLGWCFIISDPLSVMLSVFLLLMQGLFGFGPYSAWLIQTPWYIGVVSGVYIVTLLAVPLSLIAAVAVLPMHVREYFNVHRYSVSLSGILATLLLFTALNVFDISSIGVMLGAKSKVKIEASKDIARPASNWLNGHNRPQGLFPLLSYSSAMILS